MSKANSVFESDLGSEKNGRIVVRTEAVNNSDGKEYARFKLKWQNLNNLSKGFIGVARKRMAVKFKIGR